jgi:predicted dithiol-disulfide oxidoreductase (DUF899 family)
MTTHHTGTREEWRAARQELLTAEKAHTRQGDELARRRQELPWVPVETDYRFDTEDGEQTLADLFGVRSQLLVHHFMFGPDWESGCPSCSSVADGYDGFRVHLVNHDVALWAVSRAPLDRLLAYRRRMGWSFPWASSAGSEFNFDFEVSYTEERLTDDERAHGVEHNFRRMPADPSMLPVEAAGLSAFVLDDGVVYHTYSTYARGTDALWGMYQWLDRAPLGRNESDLWFRRHDEYEEATRA